MDEDDFRCPSCDSRYCYGGCRMTDTAKYFVGHGWREDHEIPEPMVGYVWSERWDGSYVQVKSRLQETLRFIQTRPRFDQEAQ